MMTKEELEKEAKKECFMLTVNTIGIDQKDVELAYVMGSEPREKQIQIDAEQIRALQKQNGELTDMIKELKDLLQNVVRVTWGEGWNYSLDWKAKAEQFLKENSVSEHIRRATHNYTN